MPNPAQSLALILILASSQVLAGITEVNPEDRLPCGGSVVWFGCYSGFSAGKCNIEIVTGLSNFRREWTLMHEQVHCLGYSHGENFDEAMRYLHSGPVVVKTWPAVSLPMSAEP